MLGYLDTLIGFSVIMLGASLMVTILTQIVSTLFSHRGANLKWGLATLFQHVPNCPLLNVPERANQIAADILSHPLISDSIFSVKQPLPIPSWFAGRFKLATALDASELVAILKDLAAKPAYQAVEGLPAEIAALVAAQNPALERRLALLTGAPALVALPLSNAVPLLQDTLNEMKSEAGKLEAWFNSTMERVSARFTMYIRLWTVAFGITLAFITGLNTVTVLSALYTNGAFREQVTGAAPQMMDLAQRVAPGGSNDAAIKMYTDLVSQALQNAKVPVNPPSASDALDSQAKADAWIANHVTDATQRPNVQAAFDNAFLTQRSQDAATVRAILSKSSFDILQFRWDHKQPFWPQLPGVFATAGLVSLGAPFWFNMLKQLSNLRPILANKQDVPKT